MCIEWEMIFSTPWIYTPDDFSGAKTLFEKSFFLVAGQKWIAQMLLLYCISGTLMATSPVHYPQSRSRNTHHPHSLWHSLPPVLSQGSQAQSNLLSARLSCNVYKSLTPVDTIFPQSQLFCNVSFLINCRKPRIFFWLEFLWKGP